MVLTSGASLVDLLTSGVGAGVKDDIVYAFVRSKTSLACQSDDRVTVSLCHVIMMERCEEVKTGVHED